MYRRPVDSSLIRSVGYDLASSVLEVEFVGGRVYEYYDVPLSIYSELMNADSKGNYFNEYVKDLYSFGELEGPDGITGEDSSSADDADGRG